MRDIRYFQNLLQDKPDLLEPRLEELRSTIRRVNPLQLAHNTGAKFCSSPGSYDHFEFELWDQLVWLPWPELVAMQADRQRAHHSGHQALVLYYFVTAIGAPRSGSWIAFSELPDGRFYTQAFQSYTGSALALRFNPQPGSFTTAASVLAGCG